MVKIKCFGVRGSIPTPGVSTYKYGGNTSCFQVIFKDKKDIFIIDAGSGIRELGLEMKNYFGQNEKQVYHIILTHTHWDHVMGLPFFSPMFNKNATINFYAPKNKKNKGASLKTIIGNNFKSFYFPVPIDKLPCKITYTELEEKEFYIDDIKITPKVINHPIICFSYRIEHDNKIFTTCFDHEQSNVDENIISNLSNSDVLIIDAQYKKSEYFESKIGWGHSYYEAAIELAIKANVKKCILTHFDPERTDEELDSIYKHIKSEYKNLNIELAQENKIICL